MSTSFHQLPQASNPRPQPMSSERVMAWLAVLSGMAWPRITILAFWVFSDLLGDAYDGWVVPALGFLVLPWTTMTYAIAWGMSSSAVSGTEWIFVVAALGLDVLTWVGVRALR